MPALLYGFEGNLDDRYEVELNERGNPPIEVLRNIPMATPIVEGEVFGPAPKIARYRIIGFWRHELAVYARELQ